MTNHQASLYNLLADNNRRNMFFSVKNGIKTLYNKQSQSMFLQKCISSKENIIPATFKIPNKPSPTNSNELKKKWIQQTIKASKDFMHIARVDLNNQAYSIEADINRKKNFLYQNLDETQKQTVNSALLEYEFKVRNDSFNLKNKKYAFLLNKQKIPHTPPPPPTPQLYNTTVPAQPPTQATLNPQHPPSSQLPPPTAVTQNPLPPPLVTPTPQLPSSLSTTEYTSSERNTQRTHRRKNRPGKNRRLFLKKKRKEQKNAQVSPIFNFSSVIIDRPTEKLLNRGLNFAIKTPIPSTTQIKADCRKFTRTVTWNEFWSRNPAPIYTRPIFKAEKTNLPPPPTPKNLTAFLNTIESNICDKSKWNKQHFNPNQLNISTEEVRALNKLKEMQTEKKIIIKPADKGAGICILNYEDYVKSCENHLKSIQIQPSGPSLHYYSMSSETQAQSCKHDIIKILNIGKAQGWLTNAEYEMMNPKNCGLAKFYQTFKVHKTYRQGDIPPTRPIINNIGSLTENISKFVDYHTRDLVKTLPSYIQDTRDFLSMCEDINEQGGLQDDNIIVTIDVNALYTNISKQDALPAVYQYLENRTNKTIPSDFITDLLELVFDCNYFKFGNRVFRQNIGVAMGTVSAPNTANLTMGKVIDPKFYQLATSIQNIPDIIKVLKRYLDDYFMIWTGGVIELEEFLNQINSIHPTLKFTYTYSCPFKCSISHEILHDCFCYTSRQVSFLDTVVKIDNGKLITDLHRKPTDRCQYLLPSSSHPPHVIKNIPYSLCYRLVRICSKRPTLLIRLEELKDFLLARNYDPQLVNSSIMRALQLKRTDTLQKVQKEVNSRAVFVTNYHPALPSISKILKDAWRINIQTDNHLKETFSQPPMVAYKQPKNSSLRQILIKSTLPGRDKRLQPGLRKCNKDFCNTCPLISPNIVTTTSSNNNRVSISLNYEATCETKSLVYCITCSRCKLQYIGETGRRLKDRIREHIGYTRDLNTSTQTGIHFRIPGHTMQVSILNIFNERQPHQRKVNEER